MPDDHSAADRSYDLNVVVADEEGRLVRPHLSVHVDPVTLVVTDFDLEFRPVATDVAAPAASNACPSRADG